MKKTIIVSVLAVTLVISWFYAAALAGEFLSGIEWAEPKVVGPGTPEKAPSDAVVALIKLGASRGEAEKAVAKIAKKLPAGAGAEAIVRECLRRGFA